MRILRVILKQVQLRNKFRVLSFQGMSSNDIHLHFAPLKLIDIAGYEDRKNDVVYGKPLVVSSDSQVVVFFPGDVQDYVENMEAHRDNKHHKEWNLMDTAIKLQNKFPESHILVIKPSRMDYKTFSCFQNFVKSSQLGIPHHTPNYNSLRHLDSLIKGVSDRLQTVAENGSSCSGTEAIMNTKKFETNLSILDLELIGFSKGCVVLNQFVYEFHQFTTIKTDEEVLSTIGRIKNMYWLDGGHSGGKNTWVTDRDVLKTLSSLGINIHVHVTPYQIQDDRRPWIKKEEKAFSDFLLNHSCKINRTVHFESISPSIVSHFDVINAFRK